METKAGWLVITHGVGPMRRYCIGAALLDIDDPTRVIDRSSAIASVNLDDLLAALQSG